MTTEPIIARGIVMNDDAIKAVIKEAMVEVIGEFSFKCPLPAEVVAEVGHFFGVVRDTGDGDLRKGVEEVRENLQFIKSLRRVRGRVADTILVTVLGGIIALIGFTIREGLKTLTR